MKVKLQLALDVLTLSEALAVARAAGPYMDWIEAGTVLIKSEGIRAVRELKSLFPDKPLLADMKVMDGGRREAMLAFGAGADIITVTAFASDATLQAVLQVATEQKGQVMVDLADVSDLAVRARQTEALGAHYLCVHRSTDAGRSQDADEAIATVGRVVSIPIAAAGAIGMDNLLQAVGAGASIIVIGGAVSRAPDPAEAARAFRQTLQAEGL